MIIKDEEWDSVEMSDSCGPYEEILHAGENKDETNLGQAVTYYMKS